MQKIFKYLKILILILFFYSCSVASLDLPEKSIYNINATFVNQDEQKVKISELSGKVRIFSMIYTNCKTICPIIISNMKMIEKLMPKNYLQHVEFTLLSLDPERDTPVTLNKFFVEKKLNKYYWSLYRTEKENVLKLALLSGIKYKKEADGDYIHSNLIVILDKNGVVKYHHQGLDKNFENVIKVIGTLIN